MNSSSRSSRPVWHCLAGNARSSTRSSTLQDAVTTTTIRLIGLAAIVACIHSFFGHAKYCLLDSQDTAWLIRTGQYICEQGKLPSTDIFSWTQPSAPFIVYQWLSECITWIAYKSGGLRLVGQSVLMLTGLLYFWILPRQFLSRGIPAAAAFGLLSIVLTPSWVYARPQIFSYFLLIALQTILLKYNDKESWKLLAVIPLLMMVWANLHSFWIFGLMMILLACFYFSSKKPFLNIDPKMAAVLLLSTLAVCINPYGLALIQYNLSFAGNTDCTRICEVLPMKLGQFNGFFTFVLIYAYLTFKTLRSSTFYQLSVSWFVILSAILVQRFEPVAVIISWPHFANALVQLKDQISAKEAATEKDA
jgi:hypothetical protein